MSKKNKPYRLPKGRALMLRTCDNDMCGHGGFAWPDAGLVKAPDWNPEPSCGGGLHGLLWGDGDASQLKHEDATRRWLVCEVVASEVVQIQRKVKVPRAWVVYVGDRDGAIAMLQAHAPVGTAIVFAEATAGYAGTATAGEGGTLSVRWWDGDASRYRIASADVGERETCKPGVAYVVRDGKLVRKDGQS